MKTTLLVAVALGLCCSVVRASTVEEIDLTESGSTINFPSPPAEVDGKNIIFFADYEETGGVDPPSFDEFPLTLDLDYEILIKDLDGTTDSPISIGDAGYFISPTYIPLEDLNITDYPPTGSAGSPFMSLSGLDGEIDADSNNVPHSLQADILVPLPRAGYLGIVCLAVAAGLGRLKSRRRRAWGL